MRAGSAGLGAGLDVNRVIAAPPGSDQARSAVRYLGELHRQGATANIIVSGKVLSSYLRSLLPFEARGRGVIPYLPYLQKLWHSALRTSYAWVDEYNLDLWEFRRQLAQSDSQHLARREHAVVLHGQQFPVEFYELLRLLRVSTTVYADSAAMVGDGGSTLDELAHTLGVSAISALKEEARTTTPIYDFFNRLHSAVGRFSVSRPSCPGGLPLLWHHETIDGEAQFVERYTTANPEAHIGLLVPLADMATAFRKMLISELGDRLQWHLARADIPRENRVNFRVPGVKILTWSSALGLEFDTVVLAGLHYANHGQSALRLATTLQMLAASAQKQLILSYSGPGEPPALNFLPRQLLEIRETLSPDTDTFQPSASTQVPLAAELAAKQLASGPQHPSKSGQKSVAEIARSLLAGPQDRKSLKRVLTADEEVGLAQLMHGLDADLSVELPPGFRGALPPGDERAAAFDAMVTHNEGLVWSIVRICAGTGMDEEDLYQHGIFGLMRAIEKFDASMGTKFSTYATWWIRQTISRGIANEGATIRLPVHIQDLIHKVTTTRSRLLSQNGHASIEAISRNVDIPPDKVAEYLRLSAGVVSLDAPLRDDPDSSVADLVMVVSGDLSDPDEIIDREASIKLVREALNRMKDRDSLVLRLRFGFDGQDKLTLEQIGGKLGLTRERIRQIEVKAKEQLIDELAKLGVRSRTSPNAAKLASPSPARPVSRSVPRRVPTKGQAPVERPGQDDIPVERLGKALVAGTRKDMPSYSTTAATDLKTWLLELIDQGLASQATRVTIQSNRVGALSWLAFIHNGEPTAWAVIRGCLLRNFAEDGAISHLWPAFGSAVSLFDEIVVWHPGMNSNSRSSMVLAVPRGTGTWSLFKGAGLPPPMGQRVDSDGPCSTVVFRGPLRTHSVIGLQATFAALRLDLGLTLGDLLKASRTTLTIGDQQVTFRDPFLGRNPAAQDLGTEHVSASGHSALVNPRVLPHPEKLLSGDSYAAGSPEEWEQTQGFYVRCAHRYLSCTGWLGLEGLDATAATSLARVAVEIQPEERGAWRLDQPGRAAMPPEPLRPRLAALASLARRRSQQVLAR